MKSYNVDDSIWARIESWEPYITLRLIVVNALIFLIAEAAQTRPVRTPIFERFALNYTDVMVWGQHYRLLTGMFLHYDFMHLAKNMVMLGLLGYMVERVFGRLLFLLTYLGAGYLGFVVALVVQYVPPAHLPPEHALRWLQHSTLGASGAVMGLLGAWFAYERSLRVSLSQMWHSPSGQRVAVLTGFYLFMDLLVRPAGVSWSAHVGGMVGGFLLGFFVLSLRYRGRTLPRQGFLALATYLALSIGGMTYLYLFPRWE